MPDYHEWQENRIKRREAEIDLLWNALCDVKIAQSREEAWEIARKALNRIDPFVMDKPAEVKEEVAA